MALGDGSVDADPAGARCTGMRANDEEDVPVRVAGFGGETVRCARAESDRFAAPTRDVFILNDDGIRDAEGAYVGFAGVRAMLCARLERTGAVRGAFRPNDALLAMLVRAGGVRGDLTLAGTDRGALAVG